MRPAIQLISFCSLNALTTSETSSAPAKLDSPQASVLFSTENGKNIVLPKTEVLSSFDDPQEWSCFPVQALSWVP